MTNFIICTENGCPNPSRVKGLCPKHYARSRSGSVGGASDTSPMPTCSVSHCDRAANARVPDSLCQPHYLLQWKGVDPETRRIRKNPSGHRMSDLVCWVEDCSRKAQQNKLCQLHAKSAKQGRIVVPAELGVKVNPPCSFEGCVNIAETVKCGLCHTHYCQKRDGRPLAPINENSYVDGSLLCVVNDCKRHAIYGRVCDRHGSLMTKYKITVFELENLLAITVCENTGCTNTEKLHIDHDHDTGVVRGRLCASCNTSLGHLGEDVARIRGLAEYKLTHS